MKKQITAALAALTLVGCQANTLAPQQANAPSLTQKSQTTSVQTSPQIINRSTNLRKLPFHLRQMINKARNHVKSTEFKTQLKEGSAQFSTLNPGGFSIKSARQGATKMYGVGAIGGGSSYEDILEYDYQTYTMTRIATTGGVSSAAIAKHPVSGEPYYLESYAGTRRLFRVDLNTGSPVEVGPTNLPTVVQLAFSRGGTLYGFQSSGTLYELNHLTGSTTVVPISGDKGDTSGDIAFSTDDNLLYRIDGEGDLYRFDIAAGTSTSLGRVSGISGNVTGIGFDPNGNLLVMSHDSTGPVSYIRQVDLNTLSSTLLQTYNGDSWVDLSSATYDPCPDMSSGRPQFPTMLFDHDFKDMSSTFGSAMTNFGNLAGETNPDTTTGWKQWNGDYYPIPGAGVALWNPGPGNDPSLGVRNTPGEYGPGGASEDPNDPRPNLLETAISKAVPLNYAQGDKVIFKVKVSPSFMDDASDSTIMLCFDDPAMTIAVSSTIRGKDVSNGELYVEAEIPSCATKVHAISMAYLGENETASVAFEDASLEFIPKDFLTTTTLLNETFDTSGTHATYGDNFPTNFDEQFGPYDIFTVTNWPEAYSGDKAVTANQNGAAMSYAGLVKTVPLSGYSATDKLKATMYAASTFSHRDSEVALQMEFFNASDTKIGQANSSKVTDSQYRTLIIDRASIPSGTTYVKMVPIFKLADSETSSFLIDNLKLELISENPPTVSSVTLNSPTTGSSVSEGSSVSLSATPDNILPGMTVEFLVDGNVVATGTQSGTDYTATWTAAGAGSRSVTVQVKDSGGAVMATSSASTLTVAAAPTITMTSPSSFPLNVSGGNQNIPVTVTAQNIPTDGSVVVELRRNSGSLVGSYTATSQGGNTYGATITYSTSRGRTRYIHTLIKDSGGNTVAEDSRYEVRYNGG